MLRIVGPQSPAQVEEELRLIVAAPGEHLQLPVRPREWWLGGELGLTQLAVTWSRLTEDSVLVTHIAPEEQPADQLRAMARRVFGFTALLMAHEIVDRSEDGSRSLRKDAYEQCRQVVEMMFRPIRDFALGAKVFLICVDHSTRSAIPWLYTPAGAVGDRIAFITLTRELITKTTTPPDYSIPASAIPKLGTIIHELFKNTDEWAKRDLNNVPWRRSVRGLSVERHSWAQEQLAAIEAYNPALTSYFAARRRSSSDSRLRFVELTVFDAGIGLARRWLGTKWSRELTVEDEYSACIACLTKHNTSSPKQEKGLGLAEVMKSLNDLDGFLKIRTGRMSLYRDFLNAPLRSDDDVVLGDFASASTVLTELSDVYGTHYQILIPLP
ncbi:MAG: hypothetical protein KF708_07910 [Pirellulales bacterium]|nr:hypothetical protein [Pirellulales bacterium]